MHKNINDGLLKYLQKNCFTVKGIHADMFSTLVDDAQPLSIVQKRAAEFGGERRDLNIPKTWSSCNCHHREKH